MWHQSLYLIGAICPARGTGAALAMPWANTHAMQAHLHEISHRVAHGAHAVLLLDRAGWHTTGVLKIPNNITLLFPPSRAPELNPVETSGSSCARPTSPTASSISLGGSCPSDCTIGHTTVTHYDHWYYKALRV